MSVASTFKLALPTPQMAINATSAFTTGVYRLAMSWKMQFAVHPAVARRRYQWPIPNGSTRAINRIIEVSGLLFECNQVRAKFGEGGGSLAECLLQFELLCEEVAP
jgi:hypothetical protein